jgi:calcineurin-like phosphoesterase
MKILFIGDIVGKPGRKALREVLPEWKKLYQPDAVIVNVENMAHGKGVTEATMANIADLGIDCYTSGNHVFDKGEMSAACFEKYPNLVRPANYLSLTDKAGHKSPVPGHGYYRFSKPVVSPFMGSSKGRAADKSANYNATEQQFLVIDLNATVFFENQFHGEIGNPFLALDKLLTQEAQKGDIIILDFHSEATSEKVAMGLYADGRVTGVFGTHTHVPTADARILPKGTAYISDVGMTGPLNSVLGVKFENVIPKFLDPTQKFRNEPEEEGVLQINGVLVEVGEGGRTTKIEKLYKEV